MTVSPLFEMNLTINNDDRLLTIEQAGLRRDVPLYSREAFELISREWVRVGWSLRYYHTFTWFGRPILQLPEDLVRLQEVVYELKPDVIVETGVFDGGSLLFHASLCEAMGKGRVIGIDVEIRREYAKRYGSIPWRAGSNCWKAIRFRPRWWRACAAW